MVFAIDKAVTESLFEQGGNLFEVFELNRATPRFYPTKGFAGFRVERKRGIVTARLEDLANCSRIVRLTHFGLRCVFLLDVHSIADQQAKVKPSRKNIFAQMLHVAVQVLLQASTS
jgi:hypothetical protein